MSTITTSVLGQVVQQNEILTTDTMSDKYDDAELIRLLCGNKTMQDKALVFIMTDMKTNIIHHLHKQGCAKDIGEGYFLEALTKGMTNILEGKFRGEGSLEGYLKTICRNLWLSALRSEKASKAREEVVGHTMTTADLTANDLIFYKQRAILLKEFLQKMGVGCSEIMLLKAEGFSSKEIVEMTDYASVSSVDRRYSICMKKVRTLMKDNPHVMNLLNELHEK